MARGRPIALTSCFVIAIVVNCGTGPAWADGIEVRPSWDGAPGTEKIQRILNVTAQVGLTCSVLSVLLGGIALGVGRIVGSTQSGFRAGQLIFGGGGGSLVVMFAAKLISWLIQ